MLKEQILKEAESLNDISVPLDSIFEAVELSDDVKAQFSTVFETTVKKYAVELAESHIQKLTAFADERYEVLKEEAQIEAEAKLTESVSKFADHLASEWMAENKLAVTNGIKADLFESFFVQIKEALVDHNVDLPEESVDVVAEMEEELTEAKTELSKLFEEKTAINEELQKTKRDMIVTEKTRDLTESQKEKVMGLIEGISWGDSFASNLNSIVEMVSKSTTVEEKPLDESAINNTDDGLNYQPEVLKEENASSPMDIYTNAAKKIKN
ncbi:prohead assembly (scaffolding) protein [Providencia phage PSTRCR_127]|nr:prohead assembly (scaffolding) protein [Providencia phage PSTRCR_127]QQV89032.1 prohead assembly (scaffolding) protein [Providencia phage PSTRCR_121]